MGKKGTPNTSAKLASNGKKTTNKSPKQKPVKVAAEQDVDMLFPENDDEWEDESDDETALKFSKKGKKSKKAVAVADEDDESDSDSDSEGGGGFGLDLARLDESDSDSEIEEPENDDEDEEEEGDEEEEDIDIDDLSINGSDEEEIRATMRVRETINNKDGLLAALKRIALDTSPSSPFVFHQSVVSSKPTADAIPSIDDDLVRELAFMNQALEAARFARTQLRKEGVPFTRPTDYFAETVRSDEIMDKVKAKLIEEATSKKASAEARKLRDLKKFGKQVQVAKQQERAKEKKATLEKISLLKKSMSPAPSFLSSALTLSQSARTVHPPPSAPTRPTTSLTSPSRRSSRATARGRSAPSAPARAATAAATGTTSGKRRTASTASAERSATSRRTTRRARAT